MMMSVATTTQYMSSQLKAQRRRSDADLLVITLCQSRFHDCGCRERVVFVPVEMKKIVRLERKREREMTVSVRRARDFETFKSVAIVAQLEGQATFCHAEQTH